MSFYGGWPEYVTVAERKKQAQRKIEELKKKGILCHPVVIEKRTIARTFWGKKWCDNLKTYSDEENRLPKGRTYVCNGSVIDLQIFEGRITALVSGSDIYKVTINVDAMEEAPWQAILAECSGKVASLVELLQGRFSDAVMEVVTRHDSGLFPAPAHIHFNCSCPDWTSMCKHVAAVLYGVGARLDSQPELLFLLREVDPEALIQQTAEIPLGTMPSSEQSLQLGTTDLSSLFGIDLSGTSVGSEAPAIPLSTSKPVKKKTATADKRAGKRTDKRTDKRAGKKSIPTLTAKELLEGGIPRHMIQNWLIKGVLLQTTTRGVYQITPETEERIQKYLSR